MRFIASLALGCALMPLFPDSASAFLCSRVRDSSGAENGAAITWSDRHIPFRFYVDGTQDLPGDEEFTKMLEAFAAWGVVSTCEGGFMGGPVQSCEDGNVYTDVTFENLCPHSERDALGYDFLAPDSNENLIIFRDSGWPHPGQEGSVIALTTTTYNPKSGEIFDGDIEFNSADFQLTTSDSVPVTDLLNTAIHEIGHLLGLGHSNQVESTMYRQADLGEISKRSLHCDDRDGITFRYPEDSESGYCPSDAVAAGCGFCAPPQEAAHTLSVRVEDSDDGQGCQTLPPSAIMPLVFMLFWRRSRRL